MNLKKPSLIVWLMMPLTAFSNDIPGDEASADFIDDNLPFQHTSPSFDNETQTDEDKLRDFYRNISITNITLKEGSSSEVLIETKEGEEFHGSLVADGISGFQRTLCTHFPTSIQSCPTRLEEDIAKLRESSSSYTYLVQMGYLGTNILLKDKKVMPLSKAHRNELIKVDYEDNHKDHTVSIFADWQCTPLGITSRREILEVLPHSIVSEKMSDEAYYTLNERNIVRWVVWHRHYQRPAVQGISGLESPYLFPFLCHVKEAINVTDIGRKTLRKGEKATVNVPSLRGSFHIIQEGFIQSPYLFVENQGSTPDLYLTRTVQALLSPASPDETGNEYELTFTQKADLKPLITLSKRPSSQGEHVWKRGLLEQMSLGHWYSLSPGYQLSGSREYEFQINTIAVLPGAPQDQVLMDLQHSQNIFNASVCELRLEHPFQEKAFSFLLSPDSPLLPETIPGFYKVVSKGFPSFQLPSALRILELGSDERLSLTTEQVATLSRLDLRKLRLTNVEISEENLERAVKGGLISKKGNVLEIKNGPCQEELSEIKDPLFRQYVLRVYDVPGVKKQAL